MTKVEFGLRLETDNKQNQSPSSVAQISEREREREGRFY